MICEDCKKKDSEVEVNECLLNNRCIWLCHTCAMKYEELATDYEQSSRENDIHEV